LDRERVPQKLRDLRTIVPGQPVYPIQAGALRVLPVTMTHSIPGACGFWISASDATVLHTGDFKLEGELDDLGALAGSSCDLLVSDSPTATRPGRSGSEAQVQAELAAVLTEATGRVVVALFSSHVERIAHFASSCARAGRRLCLLGRGL